GRIEAYGAVEGRPKGVHLHDVVLSEAEVGAFVPACVGELGRGEVDGEHLARRVVGEEGREAAAPAGQLQDAPARLRAEVVHVAAVRPRERLIPRLVVALEEGEVEVVVPELGVEVTHRREHGGDGLAVVRLEVGEVTVVHGGAGEDGWYDRLAPGLRVAPS